MEKKLKNLVPSYVSPERSKIMSSIRGKRNRSTELRFRMLLVRNGIKDWEMNRDDLPGKPDFHFPKKKLVVFIDGCFWHGCPRCYRGTRTNKAFWETKIDSTKLRDKKINRYYRSQGFKVLRIWEHQLKECGPEFSREILKKINRPRN